MADAAVLSRPCSKGPGAAVGDVLRRARSAQAASADVRQERADGAVRAVTWSLYKPEHARALAKLAVEDTGLGNLPDKITNSEEELFGPCWARYGG